MDDADGFLCAACGSLRQEENVDMVPYTDESRGKAPICNDRENCTIEVAEESFGRVETEDASEFRVDEEVY